ncbi:hypothetical protein [uncultured Paenibacillus sp.]|uniref:hypothetical protein n=1 Tax=uncultured Paenibacillus sp. TaxID=227322 RepID=UPI0028D69A75|nr:hypothetical protein [uncultured Paenibacillus sp.]
MNFGDDGVRDNEGSARKKIVFAVLAHKGEEALSVQIRNIRHFNPDADIILYNGGTNSNLGKDLDVLIYPGSHPITYGNLTPYFWEIMKWLEESRAEYDYLINLDHDVLFVKHGFGDYLDETMKDYDVMGWDMVASYSPADAAIACCRHMWKEWKKWGPLFGTDHFIRYLNSTQIYRQSIVRRMLDHAEHRMVEEFISSSNVFALEEVFFATLALAEGARIRAYPREEHWKRASRFRGQISREEAEWVRRHPYYYWIHPVKDARLIRMNKWLMGEEGSPSNEPESLMEKEAASGRQPILEQPPAEQAGQVQEAAADATSAPATGETVSRVMTRRKKNPSRGPYRRRARKARLTKKSKPKKHLKKSLRQRNPHRAIKAVSRAKCGKKPLTRRKIARKTVKRRKRSA